MMFPDAVTYLMTQSGAFVAGTIVGALLGFFTGFHFKSSGGISTKNAINLLIIALWGSSMGIDVITKQANTSIYLHALFGAVVGLLNPELFQKMLELLSTFKSKK